MGLPPLTTLLFSQIDKLYFRVPILLSHVTFLIFIPPVYLLLSLGILHHLPAFPDTYLAFPVLNLSF